MLRDNSRNPPASAVGRFNTEAQPSGVLMPVEREQRSSRHMTPAASGNALTPAALLSMAVSQGADLDRLERLMALQERWKESEARNAFNLAFANFKSEAVRVIKGTLIKDGPLKGKMHANLFDVVTASSEKLAKHGLSTAWKLTKDDPQWMEVTCTLKHAEGHSESVAMGAAPDTGPGRNGIQARGSSKTYLERYTLMAILGLAASEADDDDGHGAGGAVLISDDQYATIKALIEETGTRLEGFLKMLKLSKLDEIPAASYPMVVGLLEAKRNHPGKTK